MMAENKESTRKSEEGRMSNQLIKKRAAWYCQSLLRIGLTYSMCSFSCCSLWYVSALGHLMEAPLELLLSQRAILYREREKALFKSVRTQTVQYVLLLLSAEGGSGTTKEERRGKEIKSRQIRALGCFFLLFF